MTCKKVPTPPPSISNLLYVVITSRQLQFDRDTRTYTHTHTGIHRTSALGKEVYRIHIQSRSPSLNIDRLLHVIPFTISHYTIISKMYHPDSEYKLHH